MPAGLTTQVSASITNMAAKAAHLKTLQDESGTTEDGLTRSIRYAREHHMSVTVLTEVYEKHVGVATWDRKATVESVVRALLTGINTRKDSQEDNGETSSSGESLVSDTINNNIPVNRPQSRTRTQPDTQVPTVYSSCTEETLIASLTSDRASPATHAL